MKEGESSLATALPASDNVAGLSVVETPTQKEELELKLHQAREQLAVLRRQQEELERQKGDLEDLRRKQDEYARGRAEMIERLTRGLVLLEHEQLQAQRSVEQCIATRQSFRDYLEQLQSIRDDQWTSATVRPELSKALGLIENARAEHNNARARLDCLDPSSADGSGAVAVSPEAAARTEFRRYIRLGLAASLPIIIVGTIWLIIFLAAKH